MFILILSYTLLGFAMLIALCVMLLRIGRLMADCPITGPRMRISAITIATGFAAIGAGGVALIGAGLIVSLPHSGLFGLTTALGLAALCLGLGFTQAVATLRALGEPMLKAPESPSETGPQGPMGAAIPA